MDFERDYYATLGISSDADEQAVKQAYRQLARRYHPDTSAEPGSAERFLQIQEAYELLTDPIQREAYDHWRRRRGLGHANPLLLRVTPSQEIMPCLGENQVLYVLLELTAAEEVEAEQVKQRAEEELEELERQSERERREAERAKMEEER